MIPIRWFGAEYVWVWAVALLFILARIIIHIYRARRIRIFCNPELCGNSFRWYHRAVAILLLAFGIAFAAAIIPASTAGPPQKSESQPAIGILFDTDSVGEKTFLPQDFSNWLEDSIHWILENAPDEKFSVWKTGTPAQLLIPSTWDAQAIQLLAAGLFEANTEPKTLGVTDGVARMLQTLQGDGSGIVVISARTEPELENLAHATTESQNRVVYARITGNPNSEPAFYYQDATGKWVWESAAASFHEALRSEQQSGKTMNSWLARMSAVQTLALLAFAFLSAESMWHLFVYQN